MFNSLKCPANDDDAMMVGESSNHTSDEMFNEFLSMAVEKEEECGINESINRTHLVLVGHPDEPFLCPLGLRGRVIELIAFDGQEPQLRIVAISSWFGHDDDVGRFCFALI